MTTANASFKSRALQRANKGRSFWAPAISSYCGWCSIGVFRSRAIRLICRLEGGQMWSQTFRSLLRRYYGIEVGIHSYGSCLWPGRLPEGTRIGNYCSLADGTVALRRNHTIDRISQHPLFYNSLLGLVERGLIRELAENPLTIGHDVWIGLNVMITPGCKSIGNSAVIAAGSVVTGDVPPFAIVGGVPAKLIRWRFSESTQELLTLSQWWLRPIWELAEHLELFMQTTTPEIAATLKDCLGSPEKELPDHC